MQAVFLKKWIPFYVTGFVESIHSVEQSSRTGSVSKRLVRHVRTSDGVSGTAWLGVERMRTGCVTLLQVALASIIESSWKCRKPAARAVEAEVEAEVAAGHLFGLVRNLQILSVEFNQWKPSGQIFLIVKPPLNRPPFFFL